MEGMCWYNCDGARSPLHSKIAFIGSFGGLSSSDDVIFCVVLDFGIVLSK